MYSANLSTEQVFKRNSSTICGIRVEKKIALENNRDYVIDNWINGLTGKDNRD